MNPKKLAFCVLCCLSLAAGVVSTTSAADSEPPPPPVATKSAFVCPTGRNPYDVEAWIHVKRWCIVPGVRRQVQVKVQMEIHNSSTQHRLDIHQGRIRLIVHHFDRYHWTPARIGQRTTDRPIHTTYRGKSVWAIPANAEMAYDPNPEPGIPENLTFATHWYGTELGPEATFYPHYHYGDLVFYLPKVKDLKPLHNIVGVAYVKNADILALCAPSVWEKHRPAATF